MSATMAQFIDRKVSPRKMKTCRQETLQQLPVSQSCPPVLEGGKGIDGPQEAETHICGSSAGLGEDDGEVEEGR